ncbi:MAG TPA: hypothetical protein VNJ08_09425 [Bacteriovoracaceae bacterium]|nr:hypothetical protein [Bacteriovoracaceae bacterium]
MFKKAISFLLITNLLLPGLVQANPYLMTHERLVHLTEEQKEQLIIKTMELMVEMEEAYEKDVALNGYDEEVHQKYSSKMDRLFGFFMSSAHAQTHVKQKGEGKAWDKYANNFTNSLQKANGDQCFFGGWISKVKIMDKDKYEAEKKAKLEKAKEDEKKEQELAQKSDEVNPNSPEEAVPTSDAELATVEVDAKPVKSKPGKAQVIFCQHPSQLSKNSPERMAYEEHTGACNSGNSSKPQISCNPAIFGFKKDDKKSLFCVDSSNTSATQNTSHLCMKKSLGIAPEDKFGSDTDTPAQRKKALMTALTDEKNKKYVNSLYEYVMKSCICGGDTKHTKSDKKLNQEYLAKIKPHRTCYGMMEMLGDTLEACAPPTSTIDLTIFKQLKKHASDPSIHTKSPGAAQLIDSHYATFLQSIKTSPAYRQICNNDFDYACTPKCTEVVSKNAKLDDKRVYSCDAMMVATVKPGKPEKAPKKIQAKEGETVSVTFKGKPVACTIPAGPEKVKEPTYACGDIVLDSDCPETQATDGKAAATPTAAPEAAKNIACNAKLYDSNKVVQGAETKSMEPLAKAQAKGVPGTSVDTTFEINKKKIIVSCKLPDAALPPSTCKAITLSGEDGKITATAVLELQPGDSGSEYDFSGNPTSRDNVAGTSTYQYKKEEGLTVSAKVYIKRKDKIIPIECPTVKKDPIAPKEPKLTVTAGLETATKQIAEGKVDGDFEDWTMVWFAKGPGAPKMEVEKAEKKPATEGVHPDSTPEPKKEEAPKDGKVPDPAAAKAPAAAASKNFMTSFPAQEETETTQDRAEDDYKICGRLEKAGKKLRESCIVVPAKVVKVEPVPVVKKEKPHFAPIPVPQQGPPPPPRNSSFGVRGTN